MAPAGLTRLPHQPHGAAELETLIAACSLVGHLVRLQFTIPARSTANAFAESGEAVGGGTRSGGGAGAMGAPRSSCC